MDGYQRVEKRREESPVNENEIRITAQGWMRGYITYATSLLQEKRLNKIVFKAMGRAISNTVMIVELMKKRIAGLHQSTAIGSLDITDAWEPLEEGLPPLETIRHVSVITITLTKQELDRSSVGYQSPLPAANQLIPYRGYDYKRVIYSIGRGRGRGISNRGRSQGNGAIIVGFGLDGSGRSRGRFDQQNEANGYLEEPSVQRRGRRRSRARGRGWDVRANGPFHGGAAAA